MEYHCDEETTFLPNNWSTNLPTVYLSNSKQILTPTGEVYNGGVLKETNINLTGSQRNFYAGISGCAIKALIHFNNCFKWDSLDQHLSSKLLQIASFPNVLLVSMPRWNVDQPQQANKQQFR